MPHVAGADQDVSSPEDAERIRAYVARQAAMLYAQDEAAPRAAPDPAKR